jgi:hypothetical protein
MSPIGVSPITNHSAGKRRERRHRRERRERKTPNAFLSPPTSGTLFDLLITSHRSSLPGPAAMPALSRYVSARSQLT